MEKKEKGIEELMKERGCVSINFIKNGNLFVCPMSLLKEYIGVKEQPLEPISESPVEPISEKNVSDGNKPRPTGEEELKERISEIFVKWGLPTRQVAINEILEQLSLAREESYAKGCDDMTKDTCAKIRLFIESESGKSGRKEILKFVDSLSNQSKDEESV